MFKNLRKYFKNKSHKVIIVLWVFSYLVIFLIASTSNVLLYSRINKVMEKESEAEYLRILNEVSISVANTMDSIAGFHSTVAMSDAFKQLSNYSESDNSDLRYYYTTLAQHLASYNRNNTFSMIYIKFNSLDTVVSDSFFSNTNKFFDKFYENSGVEYDDWNNRTKAQSFGNCYPLNTDEGKFLEFLYQIPVYSSSHVKATMVFRISNDYFNSAASFHNADNTANLVIMDSENRKLYSSNNDSSLNPASYDDYSTLR